MSTLRTIYFRPETGTMDLYVSDSGFARQQPQPVTALPAEIQGITTAALDWLAAQLPSGVERLVQVILTRQPDVAVTIDEETGEPLTTSPAFEISATGRGQLGEQTIHITSVPGPVTDATAALWDYLAGSLV